MLPYIIWTIRRTGGTSFTSLLDNLSSYPSLEHEPFNKNRVYGYITHKYHAGEESTVDEIYQILKDKPNIKHCFEIIPEQINLNILKATQLLGYNQIFLYRSDQAARTMSLILSQAKNVWGPKQSARYAPYLNREKKLIIPNDHACRRKMQSDRHLSENMYKHIQKLSSPLLIEFEQLYQECEMSRKTYIEYIFSSMGIYGALDEKVSFAQLRLKKGVTKSTDIRKMIPSYQKTLKYLSKNEVPYSFQNKTRSQLSRFVTNAISRIINTFES